MPARIRIVAGGDAGREIALGGEELLLGRDPSNHVQILDAAASRHHLRIRTSGDRHVLRDLGSHNGTRVNGRPVTEHVLQHGDTIQIGRTVLVYETDAPVPAPVSEAQTTALTVRTEKSSAAVPASAERLRMLYDLLAGLNQDLDPEATVQRLLATTRQALRADVAALLVDGWPEPVAASPSGAAAAVPRSILQHTLRGGRALLLDPDATAARSASVIQHRIATAVCAPLERRGHILGVLYADRRENGQPFSEDDLDFLCALAHPAAAAFDNALAHARTAAQVRHLEAELGFGPDLAGRAPAWREALEMARKAARADSPVLLTGESGTGKEVVARRIHAWSARAAGPFVALNCAALVETLLESELFGHVRGAFTGAHRGRPGKFDAADGGTLFLDEIGEMSPGVQAKLLRALQDQTFYRVGGVDPVRVNVRIVAATNADLHARIRDGAFREDLFYRIGVLTIRLPPLRERAEDIPLLAYHFLERFARAMKKPVAAFESDALDVLVRHPWPGNVRELQNIVERAVVLCDGPRIGLEHLPAEIRMPQSAPPPDFPVNLKQAERWCIVRALEITRGRKGEAARLLGISWPTLNRKIQEYGIEQNVQRD